MKKNIFKILIIALSLAMVMTSVNLVAFADQANITAGSVKVENTYPGDTVNILQIIKPSDAARTGWVFADSTIAGHFATAYGITPTDTTLYQDVMDAVILDYEGSDNAAAASGANNASEKFRAALQAIVNSNPTWDDTDTSDANGDVTFATAANTSGAGVYLLTASTNAADPNNQWIYNNMAAYVNFGTYDATSGLPTALANVTVNAKHMTNTVNKGIDTPDESISIGDIANYTLTSYYPFFADQYKNTATYVISDSSAQLANYDEIVVKIKDTIDATTGTTLNAGVDYILTGPDGSTALAAADHGFVITMLDGEGTALAPYNGAYAGKVVEVTYQATVTSLQNGTVPNTGVVETKPTSTSNAWRTESKVITDTYACEIDKVSDDTPAKLLAGAHFVCKNGTGSDAATYKFLKAENNNGAYTLYVGSTAVDGTVTIGNTTYTVVTDLVVGSTGANLGKLIIDGLDSDNTYVFTETQAPAGYTLTTPAEWTYTIYPSTDTDASHTEKPTKETTVTEAIVSGVKTKTTTETVTFTGTPELYTCIDTKISALPSTGGIGTYIFTFVGVAVMAAAVVFFLGHKKVEA